jgi:predicted kinase
MATLHITRGLPGSGKTYYAASWVAEDPAHRARVNRDDLRAMIHDGQYIHGVTEAQIIAARDAAILALLRKGVDVICDDTNLKQRVARDLARLAHQAGAEFETVEFTDVDLETCVARDDRRDAPVGQQVIREMHRRYLQGRELPLPLPTEPVGEDEAARAYEPKPGTPTAVLVDIDGTVALMKGRDPYDETRVGQDLPNRPVIEVVWALSAAGHRIVFMSGRSEACREATAAWLAEHVCISHVGPFMRAVGDRRKDAVFKAELFDRHIRDVYDVACVLDDRRQVVEMWRAMGLTVLQVAAGDF